MTDPTVDRTRAMIAVFAVTSAAFGAFTLLLQVIPIELSRLGAGDGVAGSATGVFMATTVVTQLITPTVLRRFGYRAGFLAGTVFSTVPALGYLLDAGSSTVLFFLVLTALRGIGFGFITVTSAAAVAELAPPGALSRYSAVQGVAVTLPQLVGLPVGSALAAAHHSDVAYVLSVAVPLAVGAAALSVMPDLRTVAPSTGAGRGRIVSDRTVAITATTNLLAVAAGYGAVSTLSVLAAPGRTAIIGVAMAAAAVAMTAGRLSVGQLESRWGTRTLIATGAALGAAGLAVLAVAVRDDGSVVLLFVGTIAFGWAFGMVQTASLVMVFGVVSASRRGAASAAWNVAYDAGTGLGATAFGALVAVTGYRGMYFTAAAVVVFTGALGAVAAMWSNGFRPRRDAERRSHR
ncbi:MFS transporter [Williamsia sterculiae]|uniref:Predicted arabinose efflux permease, MFS family n=1 Tax=Williamsia sterculiae TaxID=1344003 RepID=A0A1N7D2Q1_9NOCA|nr:MFS transporter [Williamsia sterculiae]SIR70152.1 Predicted arabinose efflux permease, MFS family [Williamsia sterculiae]